MRALSLALATLGCNFSPPQLLRHDAGAGGAIDGAAEDASPPDAIAAVDANDGADAPATGIGDCNGAVCPACCVADPAPPACSTACPDGAQLYLCDGPEDCPGQSCCLLSGGGTACGTCAGEEVVCHDETPCTDSDFEACDTTGIVRHCTYD